MLKLYNTLSRKKEVFKPLNAPKVGLYTCGLTVYNYGHIGNWLSFVASDVLKRYLEYSGFKVKKVVNITDVDDKTIKGSIEEGNGLSEYTKKYVDAFLDDEAVLNIEKSWKYPRATEHIDEMVKIIQKLLDKKIAYKTDDGIYFNIKKFKGYGKLARLKLENLKASVRIDNDEYDKENANDFALWKFYTPEDGKVFWETKIGKGRPGWHIECSAMSSKYLGQPFDIHTGGVDLVFPHHENEIAQSEACTGKKFVNYWLHTEWLMVNGKKMSKSLGNFYTLRDLMDLGHSMMGLRYLYLTSHYRSQLNFTLNSLKNAENSLERLKNIISGIEDDGKVNAGYLKEFGRVMDDDLNTVKGLQVLWGLLRDVKASGKIGAVREMDKVFGLGLLDVEKIEVPVNVMKLVEERERARGEKEWGKADKLREEIAEKGYQVSDGEKGVKVGVL